MSAFVKHSVKVKNDCVVSQNNSTTLL